MYRKTVSGIMLTMLLTSMLGLAFNIQTAKAEPTTWYVDDDGGADFTKIQYAINAASSGDTIYVYNGIYYEHIYIYKSLTLIGENKYATIIDGSGWTDPVIRIRWTSGVNLTGFTVGNAGFGILVEHSNSNTFFGNIISNVGVRGIAIEDSWGNTLNGNIVSDVTGHPAVPGVGGHIAIWISSYRNLIVDNIISKSEVGIYLEGPPGWWAYNNTVVGNTISDLPENGAAIAVWGYNNDIIANNISNIGYVGIQLHSPSGHPNRCTDNVVSGNDISDSSFGINLIMAAFSNTITGNNVSNNGLGILLGGHSDNNTVIENLVSNSDYGIALFSSDNTKVYHNNFIDNSQQVLLSDSFNTVWDDGYPSGGNYWSDQYHGDCADHFSGPDQDILGSDGIVDTPYPIAVGNQDNYPLMEPYSPIPTTIDELKTEIEELGSQDEIDNQGIVTSLIAKLNVAQKLVEDGKIDQAKNILNAFINEVQAQSGKHITPEAADILVESAEYILSHL